MDLDVIVGFGCWICRREGLESPAEVHHIRSDVGMAQKSERVIPLCVKHHRDGKYSFHGNPAWWQLKHGNEEDIAWEVEQEYFTTVFYKMPAHDAKACLANILMASYAHSEEEVSKAILRQVEQHHRGVKR